MSNCNQFTVIFCVGLWTIIETTAQTARCDFKYEFYGTQGYTTIKTYYYTCYLSTAQANYNEKLIKIDGKHLTGHTDADVKYIANYKYNKLKTFSSFFCQIFPNLEAMQINHSELESIDDESLSNCKNLKYLFIAENKYCELPEYLLIRNSKLTYLRLNNNQLTTFPKNFFINQEQLKDLGIDGNQIDFLPSNIFRSLVKLEALYLFNNKLQLLNPEWFVILQNLKLLSLSKNQIAEIPSKSFASLRNLEQLWLDESKIQTLNSDSFDGLQNLQQLKLHNNEISNLPVGVFAHLRNLQELDLSNNKLTVIHSDFFGVHNQLAKIWLENNIISAIDEKFIDNTAVSFLNMTNNICSQLLIGTRFEIKPNLKKCFDNYQPRYINQPSCGKSKTGHGNIIGGTHINSGDFPWIAALLTKLGNFFCGGTVVSSRKVVTAAHCIQEKKSPDHLTASDLIVLLGAHDLNYPFEIGRVVHAVYSIKVHPDWNTLTQAYDADIAVLVLEKEVIFNEHIHPICLPVPNSNIAQASVGAVVGYGKSEDETKQHENIPKIIATPIHNNDDCFKVNEDLINLSSGRTFCSGSGKGVGVCIGDSGGGLIVSDGSAYYLRGVVSSSLFNSYRGCDVDTYAIFTNVLKFIDWIDGIPTDRFAVRRKK